MQKAKPSILVVDFVKQDRARVKFACSRLGVSCTDEQADQIAKRLHPLPDDDEWDLIVAVEGCIALDYGADGAKGVDETLRELVERYDRAGTGGQRKVEMEMFIATRGLDEHPEWYSHPCMCNECCRNAL